MRTASFALFPPFAGLLNSWSMRSRHALAAVFFAVCGLLPGNVAADSVNSPNITLNVDTNRASATGNGAGNVFVTVNTITIAETTLPEYSSGGTNRLILQARTGYQFDPTSNITCQSATIGFNGGGINAVATVVPSGVEGETITLSLTSGTNTNVQDIIRINGVKIRIASAAGAAGPAQTTMSLTTATCGGAFTDQGIAAANIQRGLANQLIFGVQPGDTRAGEPLLPSVRIVDFGGNTVINDDRLIGITIQTNPPSTALLGTFSKQTVAGVATWLDADGLNITAASTGFTLRASHNGGAFLFDDIVDSAPFAITAGDPGSLTISSQPVNTVAGQPILLSVSALDEFGNLASAPVDVTLDAAVNPNGWPLLADSSLTKATVNGIATWDAADNLRINKAVAGYRLAASGLGATLFSDAFDITPGAPAALRFVQQPADTQEDDAIDPPPSVEVIDGFGNRTNSTASVQLSIFSAGCTANITGNAVAAVDGLAEFSNLLLDAACADVQLQADAAGLVGTVSDAFDLAATPPVATRLVFSTQPVDTLVGADLIVDVTVFDQFNQPFVAAAVNVELSLATSPTGAALLASSSLIKQTAGGVARWTPADRLRIGEVGEGYRLAAAGVGAAVSSDAFSILSADGVGEAPNISNPAACGACGAGAAVAFAPLILAGMLARRPLRRMRQM